MLKHWYENFGRLTHFILHYVRTLLIAAMDSLSEGLKGGCDKSA